MLMTVEEPTDTVVELGFADMVKSVTRGLTPEAGLIVDALVLASTKKRAAIPTKTSAMIPLQIIDFDIFGNPPLGDDFAGPKNLAGE